MLRFLTETNGWMDFPDEDFPSNPKVGDKCYIAVRFPNIVIEFTYNCYLSEEPGWIITKEDVIKTYMKEQRMLTK